MYIRNGWPTAHDDSFLMKIEDRRFEEINNQASKISPICILSKPVRLIETLRRGEGSLTGTISIL